MLTRLLGLPDDPWTIFLSLTAGGLLAYFVVAGLGYWICFLWLRPRVHPDYVADPAENRSARSWSVISIVGNSVLTMPFHLALANGWGQIYWDVGERGWGWLVASLLIYLVVTETMIYWIHRALHTDLLYGPLHSRHHEYRVTTSWVSHAFHPLDSFAQALPHHLCAFLFPVHVGVYLSMLAFVNVWTVMIHDRVSIVRWKAFNYTGHHTLHHWYYAFNLGQFTTAWDRLCGTYMDPEPVRADLPPGVVVRWQTTRAAAPFLSTTASPP